MSSFSLRTRLSTMYRNITMAMPDTIADIRNTMGIRTLPHHGFALTEPKMKPT